MQFRDLQRQYGRLKPEIDSAVMDVMSNSDFISGIQVTELEEELAEYVGVKHCITCGNGTDALSLALMTWNIGAQDAVFVPDFTFFASGETVAFEGATPVFVDVEEDTFNMNPTSLEEAIKKVKEEGKLEAKAIVAVNLFGQPADYAKIKDIAKRHKLLILEDAAQGFGGRIGNKLACSFGDIACTSFFPAKPLGCYGDGGAIFTDNDQWAQLLRSYRIHGKGTDKYDNVRIGMNSRLDTIQAAILRVKLKAFKEYELEAVNEVAGAYTSVLKAIVTPPEVREGFYSSWAQYSILLKDAAQRDGLQSYLKKHNIPSMIYYRKPMHMQGAFKDVDCKKVNLSTTEDLCNRVLSLPMYPYMKREEINSVTNTVMQYLENDNG